MDLDTLGYFLYMDKMEKQQQAERERNPFDDVMELCFQNSGQAALPGSVYTADNGIASHFPPSVSDFITI